MTLALSRAGFRPAFTFQVRDSCDLGYAGFEAHELTPDWLRIARLPRFALYPA